MMTNYGKQMGCCGWCGRSGLVVLLMGYALLSLIMFISECIILSLFGDIPGLAEGHGFALAFDLFVLIYFAFLAIAIFTDNDCLIKLVLWATIILLVIWVLYCIIGIPVANSDRFKTSIHNYLKNIIDDYNIYKPGDESRKAVDYMDQLHGRMKCCGSNGPSDFASRPPSCKSYNPGCKEKVAEFEFNHRLLMFLLYLEYATTFLVALCGFNYGKSFAETGGSRYNSTGRQQIPAPIYSNIVQSANNLKSAIASGLKH